MQIIANEFGHILRTFTKTDCVHLSSLPAGLCLRLVHFTISEDTAIAKNVAVNEENVWLILQGIFKFFRLQDYWATNGNLVSG